MTPLQAFEQMAKTPGLVAVRHAGKGRGERRQRLGLPPCVLSEREVNHQDRNYETR